MIRELILRRESLAAVFATVAIGALLYSYVNSIPDPLFDAPYSTVVEASNGQLLSASIAADGQWRFPNDKRVPDRFAQAIVAFEDKRFYYHPGFDPLSMGRALWQNLRAGSIVSGGSTLTMQVVRLSRNAPPRTVLEKLSEVVLAIRLELSFSKQEILELYAAHAPFGGNVVGLEAACWRYFGRGPEDLSWGEAATLAVLPNAPALIHPGRNREALRRKRDRLLLRLREQGVIDSLTFTLACAEKLPEAPRSLPRHARHLLLRVQREGLGQRRVVSSIDYGLQQRVESKVAQHHQRLLANNIRNAAVLVLDVQTGKTLAYAGNVSSGSGNDGEEVDIITAPRSTGSILKPMLYAAALHEGHILPGTLLPDIPLRMNGFAPQNFSRDFDGVVPADEALVRSLNIPSVFLLKDYRYEKFHTLLRQIGMTTLNQGADHYGLSIILGGAEGTLWDITGMYASMARTLNRYSEFAGSRRYMRADFHPPTYQRNATQRDGELEETSWLGAAAVYQTLETLTALYRPLEEAGWKMFSSSRKIAWKTGTSFGFRDGWAVGVTPRYAVGVWTGNADGEGRPGLTGTTAAAPLLFDVFSLLPGDNWFAAPENDRAEVELCRTSGHRAGFHCPETYTARVPRRGLETVPCRYHQLIHVTSDGRYRGHSACPDVIVQSKRWFVLPPVQEHYYREKNISYRPLPSFHPACIQSTSVQPMAWVYPEPGARIFIPRGFDGAPGESIFELAHRDSDVSIYWHLDGVYIGETQGTHRLALAPAEGSHVLTVVDQHGNFLDVRFTAISGL